MNPGRMQEFQDRVWQLVAPLVAGEGRKRLMREELLAHLHDAYEEEFARLGDDQAAADAALCRLGETDELRRQLQASVGFFERFIFIFLGPAEGKASAKEIVMSRWQWITGILASLVGLGFMFGLAVVMPAVARVVSHSPPDPDTDPILKMSLMFLLALAVLTSLGGLGIIAYGLISRRTALK